MIRFCNLYSGSSGNSTYIEYNDTKILVDAGVSCQKILKGLAELGVKLEDISGILITHEHSDHTKGLTTISKKYSTQIYATEKTWKQMELLKLPEYNHVIFSANDTFNIGELEIHPFSIPHDAVDPCAFNIYAGEKKFTVATDIGHITNEIYSNFVGSDVLLLEANYDPNTLTYGHYPYFLKKRISSDVGHLSNESASKTIKKLYDETGISNIILGHLSLENNFPELAYQTVVNEFGSMPENLNLMVAARDKIDKALIF